MAVVKHVSSLTESQILSLTSENELWFDKGFYYPSDSNGGSYFYRLENDVMVKKGGGGGVGVSGIGITLNYLVIGGSKSFIEENDILNIPEKWEYDVKRLNVQGVINCEGEINIL